MKHCNHLVFKKKYHIASEDISDLLHLFEYDAVLVKGEADTRGIIPADTSDEQILACAIDGNADLIVSGDHHLLNLGKYQNIPIITPHILLQVLA